MCKKQSVDHDNFKIEMFVSGLKCYLATSGCANVESQIENGLLRGFGFELLSVNTLVSDCQIPNLCLLLVCHLNEMKRNGSKW